MKRLAIPILSIFVFSCSSWPMLLTKEQIKDIPYGASKVAVITNVPPDEAFKLVAKGFANSGCPVRTEKDILQVVCDGRSIGEGTLLKAIANIEPHKLGSTVTYTGEWGVSATGQTMMSSFGAHGVTGTERLIWKGTYKSRPGYAFQTLVMNIFDLPEPRLFYKP